MKPTGGNADSTAFTPKICLEKHVSPDSTVFWWDMEQFPEKDWMKKEAIYLHGSYC